MIAKKHFKYIMFTIITITAIFILNNTAFAYDINNPKLRSERSYNIGDYVYLLDGSYWVLRDNCLSSSNTANIFAADNIENGIAWHVIINQMLPNYQTALSNSLNNAGGDATGLTANLLTVTELNRVSVLYPADATHPEIYTYNPSWLLNSNFWFEGYSLGYAWVVNGGGNIAYIKIRDINETIYWGFRPMVDLLKTNIRGNYLASTNSTVNGTITVSTPEGNGRYEQDEKVSVNVIPNTGYQLKAGTLKYNNTTIIGTDSTSNYAYLAPAENTTVSAEFEPIQYSITYVDSQGAVNSNPSFYSIETDTFTLQDLNKDGYTFDGWYTTDQYTDKITQITKGTTGDKTLYANWIKNPCYTITIPSSVATTTKTGTFNISASNISDLRTGSVNVSVTYPEGGYILTNEAGDARILDMYIGSSAVQANKISASNNVIAKFKNNGSQTLYYSIEDGIYAGNYTTSITFNVAYAEGD